MNGHHHFSLRERIYKKLEPYPNPDTLKRFLDRVMPYIAPIGPLATLPQVYQVFLTQDTNGFSATTWITWTILSVVWLFYGLLHKEMPIVISNAISIALQSVIVIAIFLYS
jgi:MtN3 and saliva related transmembrane protein